MTHPGYMQRAVEAAAKANCPDVQTWEAQRRTREDEASVMIEAAEPFIAEHHRADERARVEERLGAEEDESEGVLRDSRYDEKDRNQALGSLSAIRAIRRALNSEADQEDGTP